MHRRWAAGFLLFFVLLPAACTDARSLDTSSSSSPPATTATTTTSPSTTTSTTTTSTTVPEPPPTTIAVRRQPAPASADVEDLIRAEFGDLADQALSVAWCESRYHPDAVNGPSRGLFQIHEVHADQWAAVIGRSYWSSWDDPAANTTFARWLYRKAGGWGPWSCKP